MSLTPKWRRYLRFWRPDPEADVDDELRTHLELRTAELRAGGLSVAAADAQALREFGDVEATRRRLYEIDRRMTRRHARFLWWDAARADVRHTLRGLRASPLLTGAVVLTLAIGIGAATTMVGVMRRLLVQPPPHVAAPESLARLFFHGEAPGRPRFTHDRSSYPFYELLRDEARTLVGVAAYADVEVPVGSGAEAAVARGVAVTAGFWRTLGTRPALGRFFTDDEAHVTTGARVVVLGHGYWQRRFGGSPDAIGATLLLKGQPYQVIGVAPRGFRGTALHGAELWLPMVAYADGDANERHWHEMAGDARLAFVGRLAPGVTRVQANAELSRLRHGFGREPGGRPGLRVSPESRGSMTAAPVGGAVGYDMQRLPEATVVVWLVGVAAVLLGVACVNVAGLLLLRALRRRREFAVRLALGMGRRRLVALLFTESFLLALLGGVAATALMVWGGAWVRRVLLPDLAVEPPPFDWGMAAVAAACVIGTALAAGLAPALQMRRGVTGALRDGTQHGSMRRSRLHATLLVTQTALSALLLVGAGLFVRSLQRVSALDLGVDAERVLAVTIDFSGAGRSGREVVAFHERALERVRALPGVERASLALTAPLGGWSRAGGIKLAPDGERLRSEDGSASVNYVTEEFFATTGTHVLEGRAFTAADRDAPASVVVSAALARRAWPGRSAVGQCVWVSGRDDCTRVVGVVQDVVEPLQERPRLRFYRPLARDDVDERALLVRVAPGAAGRMSGSVRRALLDLEPNLPYVDVGTLGSALDPQLRPWRLGAALFTVFGALAAVLAALGLYGALAYAVTQRTRELGVRVAVGATARDVVALVVRDGLRIALVGVAAGLLAALVAAPRLADLLFETSPRDGVVLATVAASLLAVALLASLLPARRAARVDPTTALRAD